MIVGGRYGSVEPEVGLSYTEMEFDHAVAHRIPIMGSLHGDPGQIPRDKLDLDPGLQAQLDAFRSKVEERIVKYWSSPKELGSQVAKSLIQIRKTHPAEGWVRAGYAATPESLEELATLRVRVRELEADLRDLQQASVHSAHAGLASGDEQLKVEYFLTYWSEEDVKSGRSQQYRETPRRHLSTLTFTWNAVLTEVGPRLLPEGPSSEIEAALKELIRNGIADEDDFPKSYSKAKEYGPLDKAVREVTFHLTALELIAPSARRHPISDPETYWSLTPFGEAQLVGLKAKTTNRPSDPQPKPPGRTIKCNAPKKAAQPATANKKPASAATKLRTKPSR